MALWQVKRESGEEEEVMDSFLPSVLEHNHRPHVLDTRQFPLEYLGNRFFQRVERMMHAAEIGRGKKLSGKTMAIAFDRSSFRAEAFARQAMRMHGGHVIKADIKRFSDAVEGGQLKDTVLTLMALGVDVIFMRHSEKDVVHNAAKVLTEAGNKTILVSAGDGLNGQNPIQALSDWFTIRYQFKGRGGLCIVLTGNLSCNRAVNSLVYLTAKENSVKFIFVSPEWGKIDVDIKDYLDRHRVSYQEVTELDEVIKLADVLYVVNTKGGPIGDDERVATCAAEGAKCHVTKTLALGMKQDAIILDPLPRSIELPLEVDENPRARYQGIQLQSRLWVIMTLLLEALGIQ